MHLSIECHIHLSVCLSSRLVRHCIPRSTAYGQHSNQLIALLNAFVIAKLLNRTLVVGHFVYNSYHSLATYSQKGTFKAAFSGKELAIRFDSFSVRSIC